jgi:hypothetical protein
MRHRPSAWMTELVEAVAGCMEAHSAMGAMGWRYREEDDLVELVVYATPVELVGGEHDGTIVIPGFTPGCTGVTGRVRARDGSLLERARFRTRRR